MDSVCVRSEVYLPTNIGGEVAAAQHCETNSSGEKWAITFVHWAPIAGTDWALLPGIGEGSLTAKIFWVEGGVVKHRLTNLSFRVE